MTDETNGAKNRGSRSVRSSIGNPGGSASRIVTCGSRSEKPLFNKALERTRSEGRIARSLLQKGVDLCGEAAPARVGFEDQMIAAFERDKARIGNACRHAPPSSNGAVNSSRQCRTRVGTRTCESRSPTSTLSMARRMRTAFSGGVVLHPLHLFRGAARNKPGGVNHAEFRTLLAPALAHQGNDCIPELDFALRAALTPSACVAAVQDKTADPLRMAYRVRDRNRAAL